MNKLRFGFFSLICFGTCTLSAALKQVVAPNVLPKIGVTEHGDASKLWLSVIRDRIPPEDFQTVARTKRPLTRAELEWMNFISKEIKLWSKDLTRLERPFKNIPPPKEVTILFGNQGGDDGFTANEQTIAMDLSSWVRNYGSASGEENRGRIHRILSHEYTHLMHRAWEKENPVLLDTPLQRALWDCAKEGIGNFRSLSEKWLPRGGQLPEISKEALARLTPIFVERMVALSSAKTLAEEKQLMAGISSGPFREKWGALPVALWLAMEAAEDQENLAKFVDSGSSGVFLLAKKYLPSDLWKQLARATATDDRLSH